MNFSLRKLAAIMFLIFFYSSNSYAYQYSYDDCRWPNDTINFYYNPTNQPLKYRTAKGNTKNLSTHDVEVWIQYAAQQWSDKSGLITRYKGITDKNPFIQDDGYTVIGWADPESNTWHSGEIGKWNFLPKYTGAYVSYGYLCNSTNKDMRMLLNTQRVRWGYKAQSNIRYWDGLITHEFGHLVGLAHNEYSNCNSVMAGGSCGYLDSVDQRILKNDDINGIRYKYPESLKGSVCSDFSDIYTKETYCKSIDYVKKNKWMTGYNDGRFFGDNQLINRAELLKTVIKAKYTREEYVPFANKICFDDVKSNEWYTQYVCFAKDKGIVKGYGNTNKFKPENTVNYVEALKIVLVAFGYPVNEQGSSNWFDNYKIMSETLGLINNMDKLVPNERQVTRDFAAHLICKISDGFCSGDQD